MKSKTQNFSFQERAAEKAASRAWDEEKLLTGQVSHASMARANGGFFRGGRYKGPSARIQALAGRKPQE